MLLSQNAGGLFLISWIYIQTLSLAERRVKSAVKRMLHTATSEIVRLKSPMNTAIFQTYGNHDMMQQ